MVKDKGDGSHKCHEPRLLAGTGLGHCTGEMLCCLIPCLPNAYMCRTTTAFEYS